MPNTNPAPHHVVCPNCHDDACALVVKSPTVMTWTCDYCGHRWAADMEALPREIQDRLPEAIARSTRRR